jgi:DNA-binding MarR family transcriptional regulator
MVRDRRASARVCVPLREAAVVYCVGIAPYTTCWRAETLSRKYSAASILCFRAREGELIRAAQLPYTCYLTLIWKVYMETNDLLLFALQIFARSVIPVEQLQVIVGTGVNQVKAYNLCDGTRTQREIATETGIDSGNLSRTIARWCEQGIVRVVSNNQKDTYLHAYPLPAGEVLRNTKHRPKAGKKSKKRKRKPVK